MNSRFLFGCCLVAAAAAANAQQVVIDPDTKQLRAPEHDEASPLTAPASAARGARAAPAASMFDAHPAVQKMRAAATPPPLYGATVKRLNTSKMSFSMATVGVDGKVDTRCVSGEAAANAILAGNLSGGQHDH